MRAELLVFLLVLAASELAAAGAGSLASGSDGKLSALLCIVSRTVGDLRVMRVVKFAD